MIGKYLNPKNDVAFRAIFGAENHKDVLIRFLNAVLERSGDQEIIELRFLSPIQVPSFGASKQSVVDFLVCDKKGVR